jgi:hypothetical protein
LAITVIGADSRGFVTPEIRKMPANDSGAICFATSLACDHVGKPINPCQFHFPESKKNQNVAYTIISPAQSDEGCFGDTVLALRL